MRLYRVIIPVPDILEAEHFYSTVFGQPGLRVSPGRHYFDLGGTILACYDAVADGDEAGMRVFHENQYVYIAVQELEAVYERVLDAGGKIEEGGIDVMPWGERLFYAQDPFGTPICFVDEKTQFTGQ